MYRPDFDAISRETSRRFLTYFLVTAGLLSAAVYGFNRAVDPHSIHGTALLPPLTSSHASRKEFLLRKYNRPIDHLTLGSSRSMTIEPDAVETVTGLSGFNASVGSGIPSDFLAWWRLVTSLRETPPKLLLLGLDLDAFNPGSREPEVHVQGTPSLAAQVRAEDRLNLNFLDAQDLGWQRFEDSARSVFLHFHGYPEESEEFAHDGVVEFRRMIEEKKNDPQSLNRGIQRTLSQAQGRFEGFNSVSKRELSSLQTLLEEATSEGARVIAFLPPIQPVYRELLESTTTARPMREALLAALRTTLSGRGVEFHDLTQASSVPIEASEFYDGVHFPKTESRKLVKRLLVPQKNGRANAIQ